MPLIFKYKEVVRPNSSIRVRCPAIIVTFSGPTTSFDITCLVDSGADISIISHEIAEELGLDLSGKEDSSYGVGGKVRTVSTQVNISFGMEHSRQMMTLPVKVILDDYEMIPLLGRRGFFERYDVTVRERKRRVELVELQDVDLKRA